jgi:hypothetical protein
MVVSNGTVPVKNLFQMAMLRLRTSVKIYSSSLGINHWGWDRQSPNHALPTWIAAFSVRWQKRIMWTKKVNTSLGVLNPGVKVYEGCRDMIKGNPVWGYSSTGGERPNGPGTVMSFEACRAVANDEGYDAFGYRTNRHDSNKQSGSCFYYSDPEAGLTGWAGDLTDKKHMSACVDPSKKVK